MTAPGFASSKAIDRFRILQPHLEEDVPLASIAAECSVAERTLRRWLAAYRTRSMRGRAVTPGAYVEDALTTRVHHSSKRNRLSVR